MQIDEEVRGLLDKVQKKGGELLNNFLENDDQSKADNNKKLTVKEIYSQYTCFYCNKKCGDIYFDCRSKECSRVHVCIACEKTKKYRHKLVKNTETIHKGFYCTHCQEEKKLPIVGTRYVCTHRDCSKSYCAKKLCHDKHRIHELKEALYFKGEVCQYCKFEIKDQAYECNNKDCDGFKFCAQCFGNKFHSDGSNHILRDSNEISGMCAVCKLDLDENDRGYKCIECKNLDFCSFCAVDGCEKFHKLIPRQLCDRIMNSEFALYCKYDQDFLQDVFRVVSEDWESQYLYYSKLYSQNVPGVANPELKIEGPMLDSQLKEYLSVPNDKRSKDFEESMNYSKVLREVIFLITPESFKKLQSLHRHMFDFQELILMKIEAHMSLYPGEVSSEWGGWRFTSSDKLKKYQEIDNLIKTSISINYPKSEIEKQLEKEAERKLEKEKKWGKKNDDDEDEEEDENQLKLKELQQPILEIESKVYIPNVMCYIQKSLGDFVAGIEGRIIINGEYLSEERFECGEKVLCHACKTKHFFIPLKIISNKCSDYATFSSIKELSFDRKEHRKKNLPKKYQKNDAIDLENNVSPVKKKQKKKMKTPKTGLKDRDIEILTLENSSLQLFEEPEEFELELKIIIHSSQLKERDFILNIPEKEKKIDLNLWMQYFAFLNLHRNIFLNWEAFLIRTLWIFNFIGIFMHIYPLPVDIFIFIVFIGYSSSEKVALNPKEATDNKLQVAIENLGILVIVSILVVIFCYLEGSFALGFGDFCALCFFVQISILGVGAGRANYKGLADLDDVSEEINDFYERFDTKTSVIASSECHKIKIQRKQVIADLKTLEMSTSAGLFVNASVLAFSTFDVPFLSMIFEDHDAMLDQLMGGYGFEIMMRILLIEGLVVLTIKIVISFWITLKTDELLHKSELAMEILDFVQKLPEPLIVTDEIFDTEITNNTVVDIAHISLSSEKMGLKFSHDYKEMADMVLNAIKTQIVEENPDGEMTFAQLKHKIEETARLSLVRIRLVNKELRDLIEGIEYKFLGVYKVDRALIDKLVVTAATLASSLILVFLNGGSADEIQLGDALSGLGDEEPTAPIENSATSTEGASEGSNTNSEIIIPSILGFIQVLKKLVYNS